MVNNRTGEVIDVAPLTDDPQSSLYRVSGHNLNSAVRPGQLIADRGGGAVY
jgi:hypothetical protein